MALSAGLLGGVPAAILGTVVLTGVVLYSEGTVKVYVDEKKPGGVHLRLPLPAAAIPLGLKFVPDRKLQHLPREMQQWLPAIRIAAEELSHCPDGPLVQVDNSKERVSIVKSGDYLVIDVDTEKETVHVSFPLGVVVSLAREMEARAPTV